MSRLFGTDGVRGIANLELTCERAVEIGRAAATVLIDGNCHKPTFLIGCDTRASSDMLCAAISAGLCSVGADVLPLGIIPTPAVAYLVGKYTVDAGIMISASHNPAEYNGIKLFGGNGLKLPDMLEERIEEIVLDHLGTIHRPLGGEVGRIRHQSNAIADYVEHLKATASIDLCGLRIALDCANGAASFTAPTLFSSLGAEIHVLHHTPNGTNINAACGSTNMDALAAYVIENGLDCGIAFDGDADRCLCIDEQGQAVDGDQIMAICALDLKERGKLKHDAVVGTVMTNLGFAKFCEANGLRFATAKVGDRYVLEEMLLEDYSFGGEQSGHIIFREFATTGDGQLTAIQLLQLLKRAKKPLSALAKSMTRYPQVTVNLSVSPEGKIAFYNDPAIQAEIDRVRMTLGTSGRILVRPSGTEPLLRIMVEGLDENMICRLANSVADVIRDRLGNL